MASALLAQLDRAVRKRSASVAIVAGARRRLGKVQVQAGRERRCGANYVERRGHDFGADAIAGKDRELEAVVRAHAVLSLKPVWCISRAHQSDGPTLLQDWSPGTCLIRPCALVENYCYERSRSSGQARHMPRVSGFAYAAPCRQSCLSFHGTAHAGTVCRRARGGLHGGRAAIPL